jgi:hypothetical protein
MTLGTRGISPRSGPAYRNACLEKDRAVQAGFPSGDENVARTPTLATAQPLIIKLPSGAFFVYQRRNNSPLSWVKELVLQNVKNLVKKIIVAANR